MVFQFVSLYPHLTVRQNVAFPLRAKGVSSHEIGKKIEWIARVFAIGDILDRYPVGLPPGSRQKAALARAVVRDPDVLLLDEPLSAVDEQYREEMRWELRHLQKELGITTVHVTHDQREAMSLADRVVLMRGGRIVQVGPPAALFNDPADRFAAFFIGSPGMNFIDLTLAAGGLHVAADQTLRVSAPKSVLERARAGDSLRSFSGSVRIWSNWRAKKAAMCCPQNSSTRRLSGVISMRNSLLPGRPYK